MTFVDQLNKGIVATGGCLCVGLDPHPEIVAERFGESVDDVGRFLRWVVEETLDHACVYKPNAAFFEVLGPSGLLLLRETVAMIHEAGRSVIYDAKRGDISSTASVYAKAASGAIGADAITVVPYMGEDAVRPFLDEGLFTFLVALPSNVSAEEIVLYGDPPVCLRVAAMGARLASEHPGQVGLVVGATQPEWVAAVHAEAPDLPWLVPGVGAQGADIDVFLAAAEGHELMAINSSRAILRSSNPRATASALKLQLQGRS